MNHNCSLWYLLSNNSSCNHCQNTPSWWPDRPLLRGVLHLASRWHRYHTFGKMYMMLAFLCRQTPAGNGTIQGRDCYHNNSRSHRSSSGSAVETHVILTFRHKRRKRATVARHWITFLVKCNFATFHLMYSSLCLKAGAFHVLNSPPHLHCWQTLTTLEENTITHQRCRHNLC